MSSVDTSIGQGGTFAQGPASPVQPPGMGITTVPTFLAPPANLSAAFKSGTLVALTDWPPAGPIDGQQAILELLSAYDPVGGKKIRWAFAYNSGDAVWDFIGGPPLYSEVQTSEAGSTSSAYAGLTTPGPAIALPRPGDYQISVGCECVGTFGGYVFMSFDIGATGAVDGDAGSGGASGTLGADQKSQLFRCREHAGLTAVTITAKYKDSASNSFANRWMKIVPVRIT